MIAIRNLLVALPVEKCVAIESLFKKLEIRVPKDDITRVERWLEQHAPIGWYIPVRDLGAEERYTFGKRYIITKFLPPTHYNCRIRCTK